MPRWFCRGYTGPPFGGHITSQYMSSGTVKFFNTEKGFGFITPDEGGKDLFVHKTGTRQPIQEGDKVTFDVQDSPKGPNAVNVTRA
jgi:CspA family cold shock protein